MSLPLYPKIKTLPTENWLKTLITVIEKGKMSDVLAIKDEIKNNMKTLTTQCEFYIREDGPRCTRSAICECHGMNCCAEHANIRANN